MSPYHCQHCNPKVSQSLPPEALIVFHDEENDCFVLQEKPVRGVRCVEVHGLRLGKVVDGSHSV